MIVAYWFEYLIITILYLIHFQEVFRKISSRYQKLINSTKYNIQHYYGSYIMMCIYWFNKINNNFYRHYSLPMIVITH